MASSNMLFDDDDDTTADPPVLKVNEEFAKRFEYNKRREELHRLQAKHPEMAEKIERELQKLAQRPKPVGEQRQMVKREREEEEDEDEDEDEEEVDDVANLLEPRFLSTLLSIKKKDPSIYDPNKKFFPDEEEQDTAEREEQDNARASKRHKPMYLKDVIAKQVLEHGPEAESTSEEEVDEDEDEGMAYNEEKEQARKAFLELVNQGEREDGNEEDDDFGGGVLKKRGRIEPVGDGDGKGEEVNQLLEEYFGREEEKLSAQDKFLRNFIMNKGWLEEGEDDGYVPRYEEILGGDDDNKEGGQEDDEQFWEEADRYEATYNFRFEEPGGDQLASHPRVIPDTVRKEESKRKKQREARAERKAAEVSAVKEEVKRLKNLKKKEIEERLSRIEAVAGKAAPTEDLLSTMLEGDFDPEEWDKKMATAFSDDYYAADEAGEDVFDREADLEDIEGYDDDTAKEGFEQLHKKLKAGQIGRLADEQDDGDEDEGEEEEEQDEGDGDGGEQAKEEKAKALADERASLQRLLEEYYKLDYEDVVAGIPTRFRYKQVDSNTFGLTVDDILQRSDKELNQIVGLKKLATYYDPGRKIRPNYKALEALKKEAPTNRKFKAGRPQQGRKQFFDREDHASRSYKRKDHPTEERNGNEHVSTQGPSNGPDDGEGEDATAKMTSANGTDKQHGEGNGQETRKRKREEQGNKKKKSGEEQKTRQQLRLESYARLSLHKDGPQTSAADGSKKKKKKKQGDEAQQQNSGPSRYELVPGWAEMTKAQRKNYLRAEKRAAKKQKVEASS